jgi:hypothetical protein
VALRGITVDHSTASVSSQAITYSGAGNIQVGDLLILCTIYNPGGSATITDPAGWTQGSTVGLSDVFVNAAQYFHVAVKIAAAGDVGTPTYTTTFSSAPGFVNQTLIALSGRINSSIAAAFGNVAATAAGARAATPYTYSITGLTALAGDDVIVLLGGMDIDVANASWTAPITGYTAQLAAFDPSDVNSPPLFSLTKLNVSAGATGTLSATISGPSTSDTTPTAFVLSLPAASGGTTYTLAAAQGSYSLTGKAVTKQASLGAAKGSISLTGFAATLAHNTGGIAYTLAAATGIFSLLGEAAARDLNLVAAEGGFAFTGYATKAGYGLGAAQGGFGLTGYQAALHWSGAPNGLTNKGYRKLNIYQLSSVAGKTQWVDYWPIQFENSTTAQEADRTDPLGAVTCTVLTSTAGLVAWVDYIPVYVVGTAKWRYDHNGFIPLVPISG